MSRLEGVIEKLTTVVVGKAKSSAPKKRAKKEESDDDEEDDKVVPLGVLKTSLIGMGVKPLKASEGMTPEDAAKEFAAKIPVATLYTAVDIRDFVSGSRVAKI